VVKVADPLEGLGTLVAFEWALTRVYSLMFNQRLLRKERQCTELTLEVFDPHMYRSCVPSE